jgi:flagellar basal-body rod modification protein FlgD
MTGVYNQLAASPMSGATAESGSSSNSGNSSSSSSSDSKISSTDFLTLLCTELKHQDPTSNADPNEYVNQLVNVNSLEQLIRINDTLTSKLGGSSSNSSGSSASRDAVGGLTGPATPSAQTDALGGSTAASSSTSSSTSPTSSPTVNAGNLGVPASNNAANRFSHALDGSPR